MPELPRSHFDTTGLRMMRNVIREYLINTSPPIIILGEPRSGKTTLIQCLAQSMNNDFDICLFRTTGSQIKNRSLHNTLLEHWIPRASRDTNTNHLFQTLSTAPSSTPPLLLIDNAHLLSRTELKGVLKLKYAIDQTSGKRFGLVLCGSNILESRVSSLVEEIEPKWPTFSLGLRPLTRTETEHFIHHLGYSVSRFEIPRLYRSTSGLPGLIVDKLENKTERTTRLSPKWLFQFLRLVAIGCIVTALLLPSSSKSHSHNRRILPLPPETHVPIKSLRSRPTLTFHFSTGITRLKTEIRNPNI